MESTNTQVQDVPELTQGLTHEEDDELRRLHYFQQVGTLAGTKLERFLDLRLRDRRKEIRPPREFQVENEKEQAKVVGRRLLSKRRPR